MGSVISWMCRAFLVERERGLTRTAGVHVCKRRGPGKAEGSIMLQPLDWNGRDWIA